MCVGVECVLLMGCGGNDVWVVVVDVIDVVDEVDVVVFVVVVE